MQISFHSLAAAAAAVAITLVTGAASAAPRYHLTDLGPIWATDINNNGWISAKSLADRMPGLWHDGEFHPLRANRTTDVDNVNDLGVAVGNRDPGVRGEYAPRAVVWKPSGERVFLVPERNLSYGTVIGSDGIAYGTMQTPSGKSYPFSWKDGTLTRLPAVPGWKWTKPTDVNKSHQIIATASNTMPDYFQDYCPGKAMLYTEGAWKDLGTLGGRCSQANGINDSGTIVGVSTVKGFEPLRAFKWQGGTMTELPGLGGNVSGASDINASGDIVGFAYDGEDQEHPVLWHDGVPIPLETIVESDLDVYLGDTIAINDAGQILMRGYSSDLHARSFLLDPF